VARHWCFRGLRCGTQSVHIPGHQDKTGYRAAA
jgi:hypothetical protein